MSKKQNNKTNADSVLQTEKNQIDLSNAVIQASCGLSSGGFPNATATVCLFSMQDNKTIEQIQAVGLEGAVFDILGRGEYVEVRMQYSSMRNKELRDLEQVLFTYEDSLNDMKTGDILDPLILALLIVPTSLDGEVFIEAINPLFWAEQTMYDGKPDAEIRMMFAENNFNILSAKDKIDVAELKAEIAREIATEESELQKEYEDILAQLSEDEDEAQTFTEGYQQYDIDREKLLEEEEQPVSASRIHQTDN